MSKAASLANSTTVIADDFWVGYDKDGPFVEDPFIRHPDSSRIWLWSERQKAFEHCPEKYAKKYLKPLGKREAEKATAAYLEWLGTPEGLVWNTKRNEFLQSPEGMVLSFPLFFVFQPSGIMPPIAAHAEC